MTSGTFTVVVNDEEQYSIWPIGVAVPNGWREIGVRGPAQDCLRHIADIWPDITPLSVRRALGAR